GIVEGIEEAWEEQFVVESDKAWDAIHRCLTDGSLLYESGEYPLNHCICGGRQLHRGKNYTVSFVTADQVKEVAGALSKVTKTGMRKRYERIDPAEYNEVEMGEEDFTYIWENFMDVRRFYKKAAAADRAVIFTVDC
ncbi:MAG: YfbM family protein, partial [Gemmataceae bacterium]